MVVALNKTWDAVLRTECVGTSGLVTQTDRALSLSPSLCAGRGSRRCSRRDSGHRDGRERRELLGRAEERVCRDEEPGGPLQRPAFRGQERTR